MIKEGHVSKELTRKVDETLKSETSAFFYRTAQQNVKRINSLSTKFDREREILRNELIGSTAIGQSFHENFNHNSRNLATAKDSYNNKSFTIQFNSILDAESRRLDEIYYEKWYEFESFNLEEAFKSQRARIESEWNSHLKALEDSINTKKASLNNSSNDLELSIANSSSTGLLNSNKSPGADSPVDSRWHHPEKQKTLIHTAPVLSPTASSPSKDKPAAGSALKVVRKKSSLKTDDNHANQIRLRSEVR